MYANTGKGISFFRDIYDWPVVRKEPISRESFIKAGKSAEVFDKYIAFIRRLYGEYHIVSNYIAAKYDAVGYHPNDLWSEFIDFCIDNNLVLEFTNEKGERMPARSPSELEHFRFIYHYPEYPEAIHICTIDEFRLAVEIVLAELSDDWYLNLRYGVSVEVSGDHNLLVSYNAAEKRDIALTREDVTKLKADIGTDIDRINQKLELVEAAIPICKGSIMSRAQYLEICKQQDDWLAQRIAIDKERDLLDGCFNIVEDIIESGAHENIQADCTDDTLYIYKGSIVCLRNHHQIEQAIAVLMDRNGRDIELNVSHCLDCNKFFLDYSTYQHYREKYGTILGNLRMIKSGNFDIDSYDLADESPLRLCGYSVSQKAGLSQAERQTIIESCILSGAMTKGGIIHLLNWFIDVNGAKKGNEKAVSKWCDDLDFVLAYNTAKQNRYRVTKVERYGRNRFRKKAGTSAQQGKASAVATTGNANQISDGSGITYYRTWKVKIYDGSFAYGVEFTCDKGKHWFTEKSFSSDVEAKMHLDNILRMAPKSRHWDDR